MFFFFPRRPSFIIWRCHSLLSLTLNTWVGTVLKCMKLSLWNKALYFGVAGGWGSHHCTHNWLFLKRIDEYVVVSLHLNSSLLSRVILCVCPWICDLFLNRPLPSMLPYSSQHACHKHVLWILATLLNLLGSRITLGSWDHKWMLFR